MKDSEFSLKKQHNIDFQTLFPASTKKFITDLLNIILDDSLYDN